MLNELLNDTRKILKIFGLGAVLFFVGVAFIQWANTMVPVSLEQEVIVLIGVTISGAGFITSITAQCLLIAQRFKNMGNPNLKNKKPNQE